MLSRPFTLRLLLAGSALYVLLHGLCMLAWPGYSSAISYGFLITVPLFAFVGCSQRARLGPEDLRLPWTLAATAMLLWSLGNMVEAWEELVLHQSTATASSSDFILFIFGVPILLAISTPTRREHARLFIWLDAIQAAMTAYLIYVAVFSVSPFTHKPIEPIGASTLVVIYTVESVVLAGGATLRLLAHRKKGTARHFYGSLACFLWIYAICMMFLNHAYLTKKGNTGFYDLVADIPFLFFAIVSFLPPRDRREDRVIFDRRPLTLFIDNVSPIFFTAALFLLGLVVIRQHFYAGIASTLLALTIY